VDMACWAKSNPPADRQGHDVYLPRSTKSSKIRLCHILGFRIPLHTLKKISARWRNNLGIACATVTFAQW